VVLHFGVYQGCGAFRLECQGKNIKNFRIPDERGNQPRDLQIAEAMELNHCLKTRFDLSHIQSLMVKQGHTAVISESAGEYICNYTYFNSLHIKDSKVTKPEKVDTLFCHVPQFEEISQEQQQAFVIDLLKEITNCC